MSAPEHQINQGDVGTPIVDPITFDEAVQLGGASVQFVYREIEAVENIVRAASIESASPNESAATSAVVKRAMVAADVLTPGVYVYEWKVTLADGTVLIRPLSAPTDDYPDRERPCFEIVASLSPTAVGSTVDPVLAASNIPITVASIAALKALPTPLNNNYALVFVMSDANGQLASFEFDAAIVADNAGNGEYVLTAGGGGFRRKGI